VAVPLWPGRQGSQDSPSVPWLIGWLVA
jgi:hypothetical protein